MFFKLFVNEDKQMTNRKNNGKSSDHLNANLTHQGKLWQSTEHRATGTLYTFNKVNQSIPRSMCNFMYVHPKVWTQEFIVALCITMEPKGHTRSISKLQSIYLMYYYSVVRVSQHLYCGPKHKLNEGRENARTILNWSVHRGREDRAGAVDTAGQKRKAAQLLMALLFSTEF